MSVKLCYQCFCLYLQCASCITDAYSSIYLQCALLILGIVLVAGVVNPWVFIPTVPLGILFVYVRKYYLVTSRSIKRLEGTRKS